MRKERIALPILWRHIVKEYVKNLSIALFGVVSLLLSTRLEEIARFMSLGASATKIVIFVLLQIPYTLQIALPLASLLAGFMVFSHMSSSGELTAMRAAGYSIKTMLIPVAFISGLFGFLLMGVVFDLSAKSHLKVKTLEFDVREEEPLAFVQNSHFFAKHGIALELKGSLRTTKSARDLLLCIPATAGDRLSLVMMKEAYAQPKVLVGKTFTMLSSKCPTQKDTFGSLFVENAEEKKTPTDCVHELAQRRTWRPLPEQFPLSVVRAGIQVFKQQIAAAEYQGNSSKKETKLLAKFTVEPFRRLSLSLSVFTLCLLGSLSAIQVGRSSRSFMRIALPVMGFIFFIALYLAGKNLDETPLLSILCFLLPHPLLIFASRALKYRIEGGRGV